MDEQAIAAANSNRPRDKLRGPGVGLSKYRPLAPVGDNSIEKPDNISDLAISHIRLHLQAGHVFDKKLEELQKQKSGSVQTLTQIAADNLTNVLRDEPKEGAQVLIQSCAPPVLRLVSGNPRLHYTVMRAFLSNERNKDIAKGTDLDEWIIRNEMHIRVDKSDWGLVTLEDADTVFPTSQLIEKTESKYRTIRREQPPTSGYTFLDAKRQKDIHIQASFQQYKETFDDVTQNCLKGLDWENVFVAGGMALNVLLAPIASKREKYLEESDIDMYIYGLSPHKALEKVRHICNTWKANLPDGEQYIIVKNSKTVTLIPKFPRSRIQIILRMVRNPTAVLLNFDLDQCAVGYTGKSVLMLPRAARAIETGYSVFTMELVHGHHLHNRRASQEPRLFKYGSRGFGVRILPSYCKTAEIDLRARYEDRSQTSFQTYNTETEKFLVKGLKAIKAVAFLGKDMVYRFYLGKTEMNKFSSEYNSEDEQEEDGGEEGDAEGDTAVGHERFPNHERFPGTTVKNDADVEVPVVSFRALDTSKQTPGAHGRRGLNNFEHLMRHVEMWHLEQEGKVKIDYDSWTSTAYDGDAYDDLPVYKWDEKFQPSDLGKDIDQHNDSIFHNFNDALNEAFDNQGYYDYSASKLRDYLTRRIRRIIHSQDVNQILDRFQIVIPVVVPYQLELFMQEQFRDALAEAGFPEGEKHDLLIPIHKPGTGSQGLPDLAESTEANLRYWIVDSIMMFAGIDRRIDEIYEMLWTFFTILRTVENVLISHDQLNEADEFKSLLNILLGRRVTRISKREIMESRSDSIDIPPSQTDEANVKNEPPSIRDYNIPDQREQNLFDSWLMEAPTSIYRGYMYGEYVDSYRELSNPVEEIPEHLYWKPEDENLSDEWTPWSEDTQRANTDTEIRGLKRRREDSSLNQMIAGMGE